MPIGYDPSAQMRRNVEFFSDAAIDDRRAKEQVNKERLQGTYAQRAADEERTKGTFAQNARQQERMQGTFAQNLAGKRELEGTFGEKEAGQDRRLNMQGQQQMDLAKYQYGPGSLMDQRLNWDKEYGRGQLGYGEKHLGLMGNELDVKKKTLISESLAKARENAVSLFPDDPAKANAYYRQESTRVNKMFPELAPSVSGAGSWDNKPVATPSMVATGGQATTKTPTMSRQPTAGIPGGLRFMPRELADYPGQRVPLTSAVPRPAEMYAITGQTPPSMRQAVSPAQVMSNANEDAALSRAITNAGVVNPTAPTPKPSASARSLVGSSLAFAGNGQAQQAPTTVNKQPSVFQRMFSDVDPYNRQYEGIHRSGREREIIPYGK